MRSSKIKDPIIATGHFNRARGRIALCLIVLSVMSNSGLWLTPNLSFPHPVKEFMHFPNRLRTACGKFSAPEVSLPSSCLYIHLPNPIFVISHTPHLYLSLSQVTAVKRRGFPLCVFSVTLKLVLVSPNLLCSIFESLSEEE